MLPYVQRNSFTLHAPSVWVGGGRGHNYSMQLHIRIRNNGDLISPSSSFPIPLHIISVAISVDTELFSYVDWYRKYCNVRLHDDCMCVSDF